MRKKCQRLMVNWREPGTNYEGNYGEMKNWWEGAETVIDLIGRKWTVQVLGALANGPRRHNVLFRAVDQGIHPTVLDAELRRLERAGLVRRDTTARTPPATWYQLTDLGNSLVTRISPLDDWVEEHRAELAALPEWGIEL
jgi:DNA-binding HxlR family transcriptional regulator